jgi:hypothetical protein
MEVVENAATLQTLAAAVARAPLLEDLRLYVAVTPGNAASVRALLAAVAGLPRLRRLAFDDKGFAAWPADLLCDLTRCVARCRLLERVRLSFGERVEAFGAFAAGLRACPRLRELVVPRAVLQQPSSGAWVAMLAAALREDWPLLHHVTVAGENVSSNVAGAADGLRNRSASAALAAPSTAAVLTTRAGVATTFAVAVVLASGSSNVMSACALLARAVFLSFC